MKLDVINIQGSTTGRSVDLPADIFEIEPNNHAVYLAVKSYNAAQRQGTHKSKERGEVKGSTRKIKRQKGTGTARFGDIKNPIFRGGGRIFGPRPHKYSVNLNKKVKRLAKMSALSSKASSGELMIIEDFSFDQPKTKEFLNILKNLKLDDKKILLVTGDIEKSVYLSGRNLPKTQITHAQDLNTFSLLNAKTVILSESSLEKIKESLSK